MRFFLSGYLAFVLMALAFGQAQAGIDDPFYSYSSIYAKGGYVSGGLPGPESQISIQASDQAEAAGETSLADGGRWWCLPTEPDCSISFAPGAGLGWAEASADPEGGVVGTRNGSRHMESGPVPNYCVMLGNQKLCFPVSEWGESYSQASIRQVWQVGSNGSLEPGTSVSVQAAFSLEGEFTDDLTSGMAAQTPTGTIGAALFLGVYDPDDVESFYLWDSYINWGGVEDILGTPALEARLLDNLFYKIDSTGVYQTSFFGGQLTEAEFEGSVLRDNSFTASVEVGDVIILDLVLSGSSVLKNDDLGREAWSEFGNTLSSSLTALTEGVVLRPVREPSASLLLGAAIVSLSMLVRLRRE